MTSRRVLVLFGSETGCAQEVAERVVREARNRLFHTRINAMDDYDKVGKMKQPWMEIPKISFELVESHPPALSLHLSRCFLNLLGSSQSSFLDETNVIFICSTAGQGDPPANMRNFWRFLLKKSLQQGVLDDIRIAVFGLGDSSYAK